MTVVVEGVIGPALTTSTVVVTSTEDESTADESTAVTWAPIYDEDVDEDAEEESSEVEGEGEE